MASGSRNSSYILSFLLILAFLAIGSTSVLASDSLQFSGVISDSSGAVVPGATVTVVNLGTARSVTAVQIFQREQTAHYAVRRAGN